MTDRTLTITLQPDWQAALRLAAQQTPRVRHQSEVSQRPLG